MIGGERLDVAAADSIGNNNNNKNHSYTNDDMVVTTEMHMRAELHESQDLKSNLSDSLRTKNSIVGESTALLLEQQVVHATLEEVDRIATRVVAKGFNELFFTIGVVNCLLVVYVFGVYPQHFWLLYLVEGLVLISAKVSMFANAKPLNNILYLLDFCWIMNVVGIMALLLFCCDGFLFGRQLSEFHFYLAAAGMACGPLLGSCLVLPFVCLLFHDVGTMADLFIHIFPPMVMYTLRWTSPDTLRTAWPNVFALDYFPVDFFPVMSTRTIAGMALGLYMVWWVLYTIWMLTCGMALPGKGYDTVFHSLMRGGLYLVFGGTIWNRPRQTSLEHMQANTFEVRDFLLYMFIHAVMSMVSIFVLGYLCFMFHAAHGLLLIFVTIVTTHKGAQRYTYYTTTMYGRLLRRRFLAQESERCDGQAT